MNNPENPSTQHDIIYALRTTHQHQTQLLMLADQKANILIGIVALILTLLAGRLDALAAMDAVVTALLGAFVLAEATALLVALFVVMPRSAPGTPAKRLTEAHNPFYFGCFTAFSETEYVDYLAQHLNTDEAARAHLARDIYQNGAVLRSKYGLLRVAYGFACTGIVFVIAAALLYFYR